MMKMVIKANKKIKTNEKKIRAEIRNDKNVRSFKYEESKWKNIEMKLKEKKLQKG